MKQTAAKLFSANLFIGCRFDKGRPSQKYRALIGDDDILIGHGRHIGSARRTGTHDNRDLRNAVSGHGGFIIKATSEHIFIGEYLCLMG